MRRIVVVLLLLVWISACAELEPTPEPTATPWLNRQACLDLNEIVDDWIAGIGSDDPDAFIAELRKIHSRLTPGSNARESLNDFLNLMNPGAAAPSDQEYERRFNRALTDCELSPLPTPKAETMVKPTPKPAPTATPKPRPTSIPVNTVGTTPEPTVASPIKVCEEFHDLIQRAYRDRDEERAIRIVEVVAELLGKNPDADRLVKYCENMPSVYDLVAATAKRGNCSVEIDTIYCFLWRAVGVVDVVERKMRGKDKGWGSTPQLHHIECALQASGMTIEGARVQEVGCRLTDVPRALLAVHEPYVTAWLRTLQELEAFHAHYYGKDICDRAGQTCIADLSALDDRDKDALMYVIRRVMSAWNKFEKEHDAMLCQYIVCE